LECYDEHDGCFYFCFYFTAVNAYGDSIANAIKGGYTPGIDLVVGQWWWYVHDTDPVMCGSEGIWVGSFDTVPNADYNGFTFQVEGGSNKYTVTVAVSKSQSGECIWTGTYSWPQ
jgi:hypothetical protein